MRGLRRRYRQPLRQSWQSLHQVVVDDHREEEDQEDERGLVDAFFNPNADVAPHDAFDDQQQDDSAVEDGNRQQVEDAEVQADHRHQAQQRRPAWLARSIAGSARNANRSFHLLDGDLALQHFVHQVNDQQRIFLVLFEGAVERHREGQLVHAYGF